MSVPTALKTLFEEQVEFQTKDDEVIDGSVFIGETEFLPVETLRDDKNAYEAEFERWYGVTWLPKQQDMLDHLLGLHGNAKRYTDLTQARGRNQLIPFVGSGMSVLSGCPTWSEFLRALCKYATAVAVRLEELLQHAAFEEAADLIASNINTNLFNERVEHDLRVDNPEQVDGAIRLLPAIFSTVTITTNLDNVLESVFGTCNQPFAEILAGQEIAKFRDIRGDGTNLLLKLHGDCRRPDTRVLLKSEYEQAYSPDHLVCGELSLLYKMHHLLFMGCSLGPDRTVQLIADVAKTDKNMPKHYAFLSVPAEDSERIEREHFLTERGIYPIWYDGAHDECIMALLAGLLPK